MTSAAMNPADNNNNGIEETLEGIAQMGKEFSKATEKAAKEAKSRFNGAALKRGAQYTGYTLLFVAILVAVITGSTYAMTYVAGLGLSSVLTAVAQTAIAVLNFTVSYFTTTVYTNLVSKVRKPKVAQ